MVLEIMQLGMIKLMKAALSMNVVIQVNARQ